MKSAQFSAIDFGGAVRFGKRFGWVTITEQYAQIGCRASRPRRHHGTTDNPRVHTWQWVDPTKPASRPRAQVYRRYGRSKLRRQPLARLLLRPLEWFPAWSRRSSIHLRSPGHAHL